jgi:hypothetical protein
MKRIAILAVGLVALTACTPTEINNWLKWHRSDPEAAQEYLTRPEVQEQLAHHQAPAPQPTGYSQESSNGRCVGFEGLLAQHSPGWDVGRMSAIAYRESRCQPSASNSCCTGLLQVHYIWIPKAGSCGVYSRSDLQDPAKNICTAAIIYRTQGMQAWSTS